MDTMLTFPPGNRQQLETEKKRRETVEREKEQMMREKEELMLRLQDYEEKPGRLRKVGGASWEEGLWSGCDGTVG